MTASVWGFRATFAGLSVLILFFALLPFGPAEGAVPGPELALCLACAFVMRRPDYAPPWLIVPLVLLGDALLMRPLGLWALVVLLVTEWLRRRVDQTEAIPFWSECATVAGAICAAFVAHYAVLVLLLAERPPLLGETLHMLATVVFYPPTAIFTMLLGVRRLAPGELDSLGTRA